MAKAKGKKQTKLNPKQELFCQLYVNDRECFGNATISYARAYNIDIRTTEEDGYNPGYELAKTLGSREFTRVHIRTRVTQLFNSLLKDEIVDSELAKVIQQDEDRTPKIAAIKEYNKLKQRIIEKGEVKVTGTISLTDLFNKSKEKSNEIPTV